MANTLNLIQAKLVYGRTFYEVPRTEHAPIPDLDLDNLEESVFQIVAVLSNQSGGHTLGDIRVSITADRSYAYLNGNGFAASFGTIPVAPEAPSDEQIAEFVAKYVDNRQVVNYKWSVRSDQYGEGWKRAVKVFPKAKTEGAEKPRWRK